MNTTPTILTRNLTVTMRRETLACLPSYPVPAGHRIRAYQPGDEEAWVRLQMEADRFNAITPALYRQEFGGDVATLADRQFFVLDSQAQVIGTATAWFDDHHLGRPHGRVHWVAIAPAWQGHGLAKPLLAHVCDRLRTLGHDCAYLVTSTARVPAINLYLKFGFRPEIQGPDDALTWNALQPYLKLL